MTTIEQIQTACARRVQKTMCEHCEASHAITPKHRVRFIFDRTTYDDGPFCEHVAHILRATVLTFEDVSNAWVFQ